MRLTTIDFRIDIATVKYYPRAHCPKIEIQSRVVLHSANFVYSRSELAAEGYIRNT